MNHSHCSDNHRNGKVWNRQRSHGIFYLYFWTMLQLKSWWGDRMCGVQILCFKAIGSRRVAALFRNLQRRKLICLDLVRLYISALFSRPAHPTFGAAWQRTLFTLIYVQKLHDLCVNCDIPTRSGSLDWK